MQRFAILAVLVLLAGCSDPAPTQSTEGTSTTPTSGTVMNTTKATPVAMSLPVSLDGNLGSFAHYCVFPANACNTQTFAEDNTDVIVEHPGANFTGLDLNLTWSATSPATQTLTLGFMVMADCAGCSTSFDEVTGTSPLHATLAGQAVPLNATARVHIYVYNPSGLQVLPGGAGYTFVSVDDPFALAGSVKVLMPAT